MILRGSWTGTDKTGGIPMLDIACCGYMVTFAAVIYYEMVIRNKDKDWLSMYLVSGVIVFMALHLHLN